MLNVGAYTTTTATPADNTLPPVTVDTDPPRVGVRGQVGPYAIMPLWTLQFRDPDGKRLTSSDLRVLLALRSFVSSTRRRIFPSTRQIASRAGLARGTTENAISRLRHLGLIRSRQRHCAETGALVGVEYWIKDSAEIRYNDTSPITSQIGPWALVPMWTLAVKTMGKGMTGSQLRTYIALRSYASADDGIAWPRVSSIAKRAGVAKGSAHNALMTLREMHLIRSVQVRGVNAFHNYYEIQDVPPDDHVDAPLPPASDPQQPTEDPWAADTPPPSPPDSEPHTEDDPWAADTPPPSPPTDEPPSPLGGEPELTNKELTNLELTMIGAARCAHTAKAPPAGLRPRLRDPDREQQDRALFANIVGDTINLHDQHRRLVDTCSADHAYDLLRAREKITAPGAYLATVGAAPLGGLNAIDEWLLSRNLERMI